MGTFKQTCLASSEWICWYLQIPNTDWIFISPQLFSLWRPFSTGDWSWTCRQTDCAAAGLGTARMRRERSGRMLTWSLLAQSCVPWYCDLSDLSLGSGPASVEPCWYHLWSSSTGTETWNQLRLMLSLQNYTSRYFINSYKLNSIQPNGFTRDHYLKSWQKVRDLNFTEN